MFVSATKSNEACEGRSTGAAAMRMSVGLLSPHGYPVVRRHTMFDFPKWFRKTFRTELRFGGRGSTRPQRRASLGVECLEDRVVLNGLPPGYALTGGNLYHITSSGQQLLDSGVSSACVETVNGTDYVYDL